MCEHDFDLCQARCSECNGININKLEDGIYECLDTGKILVQTDETSLHEYALIDLYLEHEKEIKLAMGQEVYFGEILGKHSEVYGILEEADITEVKVSETTIKEMEEVLGTSISGYNPLNYLRYTCSECGESFKMDECNFYLDNDDNILCDECVSEENQKIFKQLN